MPSAYEARFGILRAPHRPPWPSDKGAIHAAAETTDVALALGPDPRLAPVGSPKSNGISGPGRASRVSGLTGSTPGEAGSVRRGVGSPVFHQGVAITAVAPLDGRPLHFVTDPADAVIGAEIRRTGRWQEAETGLISSLVGPGDHAVDAGAHIGYFTVVLASRIGPTGRVCAFEPEPRNFALLKANCILNGCANVELQPAALGARSGRSRLYLGRDNLGDHRLHPVAGREACAVEVVRLDDCRRGHRLDFLKLDTQGSEAAILSGAIETIRANADRLICLMEVSPRLSEAAGHGRETTLALLAGLGARAFSASLPPRPLEPPAVAALWDRLHGAEADDANEMILLAFSPQAAGRLGGGPG